MMTCEQVRDQIDLHFGCEELPDDLHAHLAECDSCRAYRDELMSLAGGLGADTDTPFTTAEFDYAAAAVAERIDLRPTVISYPARWLQPMLRVAAALLVVGVSYGSYHLGLESGLDIGSVSTEADQVDGLTALSEYDADEEMDEELIGILINDYCTTAAYEATASLLDDISAEELEYLKENLEVGELL